MSMHTASGRSLWPWIIGAATLVVIVAIVAVVSGMRGTSIAAPTTAPQPNATTHSSAPADVAPTGCLGGTGLNAATVIAAQKAAPDTTNGAVEVATTFYRWSAQYPYPTDGAQVEAALIASAATPQWKDLTGTFANAGDNPAGTVVPADTPFHMSTINGIWHASRSSDGVVLVDMAAGYVINDALSATKVGGLGLDMKWQRGGWRVLGGHVVNQTALTNDGTHYTAGC